MRHWGDQIRGLNKFIFQLLNITVNLKTHKSFAEQLYKLEWICRIVQCLIDWDIKQSQRTPSHLLNHPEIDPLSQLFIFPPLPSKNYCKVILRLMQIICLLLIHSLFSRPKVPTAVRAKNLSCLNVTSCLQALLLIIWDISLPLSCNRIISQ